MMKFWNHLLPIHCEPSAEAVKGLEEATRELARTIEHGTHVFAMSDWLDRRREENHFGDALDISFKRRNSNV